MNLSDLNQKFGIAGRLKIDLYNNTFPACYITNPHGTAVVSLYGAHIISYIPKNKKEVLWMSSNSFMEEGKPIRGGIPVCFPWFGPHASDTTKPMHGFGRLLTWELQSASQLPGDSTQISMTLADSDETRRLWPYSFKATLTVIVGPKLEASLEVQNDGNEKFTYSDALHTYYNISHVDNIVIRGLGGTSYYDGLNKDAGNIQENDELYIAKEENRRHYQHAGDCVIEDKGWKRKITASKKNSRVTLVWNPWIETARKMADMPDDGYQTMVCIEAVNYYDDSITLNPGEKHSLGAVIGVD